MKIDWKTQIAVAWRVQQCNQEEDRAHLWDYHLPRVAATEDQILQAEAVLGHALDPGHRLFLSYANGWPDFYQAVDLFGTSELAGNKMMRRAWEVLAVIDNAVWQSVRIALSDVLPIAVSKKDRDVFVTVTAPHKSHGKVVWLSGQIIDHFSDFNVFFLSMVDYNRETLADFKKKATEDR